MENYRVKTRQKPFGQIMKEAMAAEQRKEEENDKQHHNAIIFRAAECGDKNNMKRIQYDQKSFDGLCSDMLKVEQWVSKR